VQGKTSAQAEEIFKDAVLLDKLGAFAIVLECVPAKLAGRITQEVCCPTIGIGAGAATDGQVLVLTDMLGFRGQVQPKFVRAYAELGKAAAKAFAQYRSDVVKGKFPSADESY
jgi:3-methyl-2-oxobutanoate hydroxymethyltransferase